MVERICSASEAVPTARPTSTVDVGFPADAEPPEAEK